MPARYFCHECQNEGEWDSPICPVCTSPFVEEIPSEDDEGVDDPRDFDPDDEGEDIHPLEFLAEHAAGGGGLPFLFQQGGAGGGGSAAAGGVYGGGNAGEAPAAAGGGAGGAQPGLNPLTTAMLQAFGVLPPAQGFAPPAPPPGARGTGEEEAGDPEEEHAGGAAAGAGGAARGGGQPRPILNLAAFLGEAFGPAIPHPADDADNNPFAEGGHERRTAEEIAVAEARDALPQLGGGGPFGALQGLLSAFGIGAGAAGGIFGGGVRGQAGDYVFGEQNFQQILTDLMEQAAGRAGPQPAPDDMIEKLPRVAITQDLLDSDSITSCPICQDAYTLSEETLVLPCKHLFHVDCLTPWLKNSGTCPTCRYALVPQPGQEGYGEAAPGAEGTAATEGGGAAASSSSTALTGAAAPTRPAHPSRQGSLGVPVAGGSSLPGSWVWPGEEGGGGEEEDRMVVDEVYGGGSSSTSGNVQERPAASAAAEAAVRRARVARQGSELEIEDVD